MHISSADNKKSLQIREGKLASKGALNSGFIQLPGQTGLFAIGSVLMDNTLGRGLVDHGGSRGQLGLSILRIFSDRSLELADRCTHTALHNAIMQILLLTDLHALLCGLDIRQPGSPP